MKSQFREEAGKVVKAVGGGDLQTRGARHKIASSTEPLASLHHRINSCFYQSLAVRHLRQRRDNNIDNNIPFVTSACFRAGAWTKASAVKQVHSWVPNSKTIPAPNWPGLLLTPRFGVNMSVRIAAPDW